MNANASQAHAAPSRLTPGMWYSTWIVAATLALALTLTGIRPAMGVSLLPGWPQTTGYGLTSSAALGDLDGDGNLEVVLGGHDGKVYAWHHDGTPVAGWPQATGRDVYSSPALGDLEGDGKLEVVVGSTDGKVYAWHHDGTPVAGWPQTTGGGVASSPALGDLDGDGNLEVVVGSDDGKVYAWQHDGTPVGGWPQITTVGSYVRSSPALGDLDGDGNLEVVAGSYDGKVYAWHADGIPVAGWPQTPGNVVYPVDTSPALGDLDGDGKLEALVECNHRVYAWHYDGTRVTGWPQTTGGSDLGCPALGDLDGDGKLEVVSGCINGQVYVWHADGTPVIGWQWTPGAILDNPPALADLDGDARLEVVIGSWSPGAVYAWHADGTPVAGWPETTDDIVWSSPALGDLDGDGKVEVVVGSQDGKVYAWRCDTPTDDLLPWPMLGHDAQHTGLYAPVNVSFTVTPSPGANGTISPDTPQTVTYNGSVTFTATPAAGYVVDAWAVDGSMARSGGTTFTLYNVTANRTVNVTFTTTVPGPLLTEAGPDRSIALGDLTTLAGSAAGGTPPYIYSWSPATGLSDPNVAQPNASPTTTTTYHLTTTDSLGRTDSDAVTVTVQPVAGTAVLTAMAVAGPDTGDEGVYASPGDTITIGLGISDLTGSQRLNTYSFQATIAFDPTAKIFVPNSPFGCIPGWDPSLISLLPPEWPTVPPDWGFVVTPGLPGTLIIQGQAGVLGPPTPLPNNVGDGTGDLWLALCAIQFTETDHLGTTVITPTSMVFHDVPDPVGQPAGRDDVAGLSLVCQNTIGPLPVAEAGPSKTIGPGGSTTLDGSARSGTPPYTYSWTPTEGLDDASKAQPIASPTTTTTYTLTVTDSLGNTASDSVTVTVVPVVAEAGPDRHILAGDSTTLLGSASGGQTPYTYSWAPTDGLDDAAKAQPTASPTTTTTYTLTVRDSLDNSASDNVTVTVVRVLAEAGPDKTIALGDLTTLDGSASLGTPPYTYSWSPATGLSDPNVAQPTASPTATTTYTLTVRDSLNHADSDTATVTVQPPTGTTVFTAVGVAGEDTVGDVYASPGNTTTIGLGITDLIVGDRQRLNTYSFQATIAFDPTAKIFVPNSPFGCIPGWDPDLISHLPPGWPTVPPDWGFVVTPGLPGTLTIQGQAGMLGAPTPLPNNVGDGTGDVWLALCAIQFTETDHLGTTVIAPTSMVFHDIPDPVGQPAGRDDIAPILLQCHNTIIGPLSAEAGLDKIIPPGGSTTLEGSASGGMPPYAYAWTPTDGLSDPNAAQPITSPTATTTYTLTVTDSLGATASDTVTVTVSPRLVSAPQVEACPGSTVTVPIAVSDATSVAGAQFDLRYDPAILTAAAVEPGELVASLPGWQLYSQIDAGRAQAIIYNDQRAPLGGGGGGLINVVLQVNPAAVTGQSSILDLRTHILSDVDGFELLSQGVNGSVTVIAVDHFVFGPIMSPQGGDLTCPLPFLVHVEARDANDALVTAYGGTAALTASVGTAQPPSIAFTNGVWEGPVSILADLDPDCTLTAQDASVPASGTSNTFSLRGKGDINADSGVNVLDVMKCVNIALSNPIIEPPRAEFQLWAADMNADTAVNVLDVVLIVNKSFDLAPMALARAKASLAGPATTNSLRASAAAARPVSVSVVKDGRDTWAVKVSNAAGLAGAQLEVDAAEAGVTPGALIAAAGWQAQSNLVSKRPSTGSELALSLSKGQALRVIVYSPSATGLATGDGVLLRLTGVRGKPKLENVVLSDAAGRAMTVR